MPQTDITFKELFGRDVQPLLGLLLPEWAGPFHVVELNPELPATLRRVDLLVRGVCRVVPHGPLCDRLIAIDWQVQADPELPATMLLRGALAYHKYRVRVTTLLLAATPAAAMNTGLVFAEHDQGELVHDVLTIKLYEQDAERALARDQPELWVLAAAMMPPGGSRGGGGGGPGVSLAVPEPSVWLTLACGLALVLRARRTASWDREGPRG